MEFPFSESTKAKKKSRKGSVPMNVETLMKQDHYAKGDAKLSSLQFRAFAEAVQEKLAFGEYNPTPVAPLAGTYSAAGIQRAPTVSSEEAFEAVKQLQKAKGPRKQLEAGAVGGVAAPFINVARGATKGFLDTKGGLRRRLGGAAAEVGKTSLGDVGAQVVGGGLTGVALSAGREGLKVRGAKKKLRTFLTQQYGQQVG